MQWEVGFAAEGSESLPLYVVKKAALTEWLAGAGSAFAPWVHAAVGPQPNGREALLLPGASGAPDAALCIVNGEVGEADGASAASALASHTYQLAGLDDAAAARFAHGWALASYRLPTAPEEVPRKPRPKLVWTFTPEANAVLKAIFDVRNWVNLPANLLGPAELATEVRAVAEAYHATFEEIVGEGLRSANYPLIEAVGRASVRAPRLVDLRWGPEDAPKLTLVGKGVCFDTGGLNLKPGKSMSLMKKDMGGAAHALALAEWVMSTGLHCRLRLLIGAVENAVSGAAIRPGDVFPSRKGLTVEIENTDAEGRLVLADCLAEADSEAPELLIDFATLTGAARVALGPDLPALFTRDRELAQELMRLGEHTSDPLWQLPLHAGYESDLRSDVADVCHTSRSGFAGAITAALFLGRFVSQARAWAHIDVYSWNPKARPGKPVGGEAQGLRPLFAHLATRFPPRST